MIVHPPGQTSRADEETYYKARTKLLEDEDDHEELLWALQDIWPQFDFSEAIREEQERVKIEFEE